MPTINTSQQVMWLRSFQYLMVCHSVCIILNCSLHTITLHYSVSSARFITRLWLCICRIYGTTPETLQHRQNNHQQRYVVTAWALLNVIMPSQMIIFLVNTNESSEINRWWCTMVAIENFAVAVAFKWSTKWRNLTHSVFMTAQNCLCWPHASSKFCSETKNGIGPVGIEPFLIRWQRVCSSWTTISKYWPQQQMVSLTLQGTVNQDGNVNYIFFWKKRRL